MGFLNGSVIYAEPSFHFGSENQPLRLPYLCTALQRRKAKMAWKMDFGPRHFFAGVEPSLLAVNKA